MLNQQNRQPSPWYPSDKNRPPPYKQEPAPENPGASDPIAVNVDVDPENREAAIKAAENVAKALTKIRDLLENMVPSAKIVWFAGGDEITVSEALVEINNTMFTIEDRGNYQNGGVGSAERGRDGRANAVNLNYLSFDGTGNDYASPNYVNGQGMVAIMLHELAHVTAPGNSFRNMSEAIYFAQYKNYNNWIGSPLWYNNERYAYNFAKSAADAMRFSIDQFWGNLQSTYRQQPVDPITLANDTGPNP